MGDKLLDKRPRPAGMPQRNNPKMRK